MPERFALPRIIAALRDSKGLNQSQLAAELGVSPSAANQVENEEHGVQETVFIRYATACGYPDELDALEAGVRALRKQERANGNGAAPAKASATPKPKASKPPKPARSSKSSAKRTRSKRSKPARAAR